MTKEERLAALEILLEASSGHIERAWAYDHYAINYDGVKGLTIEMEHEIAQSVGNEGDVGLFGPLQYQPDYHIAFVVDSKNKAKRLRKKFRKWLYAEITKLEQPPIDPKEIIEAASADGAAMDAAESLLDREQMRFEIGRKVHDFQSAVQHLYKALDAGYAKDDEIAALKKEINKLKGEAINQEAIINTLKYKIEQQAKEGSQPRTRTAADAKIGEIVLFWDTVQSRNHGPIVGLGDSSVFVQDIDGKIHRLPHHEFGLPGGDSKRRKQNEQQAESGKGEAASAAAHENGHGQPERTWV